jgi:hypothetical protein
MLGFLNGYIVDELRALYSQLKGYLSSEHTGTGAHGAITAESLAVEDNGVFNGTQSGGLEHAHGNVVIGDLPAAGLAIGGYGLKFGLWRIIEDRAGASRDVLIQCPDLLNAEGIVRLAANGGIEWAIVPGSGAALRAGTSFLPLSAIQVRELTVEQTLVQSGAITPTMLTGNQNDYAPGGITSASSVNLSADAARNITGIAAGQVAGRRLVLTVTGGFAITLVNESASSTAANRFTLSGAANLTLASGASVELFYAGRWFALKG